jgi:hypothetical protein
MLALTIFTEVSHACFTAGLLAATRFSGLDWSAPGGYRLMS